MMEICPFDLNLLFSLPRPMAHGPCGLLLYLSCRYRIIFYWYWFSSLFFFLSIAGADRRTDGRDGESDGHLGGRTRTKDKLLHMFSRACI